MCEFTFVQCLVLGTRVLQNVQGRWHQYISIPLPHQLRRPQESRPATGPFTPRRATVSPTHPMLPHPRASLLSTLTLRISPELSELLLCYLLCFACHPGLSGLLDTNEDWHPQLSLWGMGSPQTETPEALIPTLPSGLLRCHLA